MYSSKTSSPESRVEVAQGLLSDRSAVWTGSGYRFCETRYVLTGTSRKGREKEEEKTDASFFSRNEQIRRKSTYVKSPREKYSTSRNYGKSTANQTHQTKLSFASSTSRTRRGPRSSCSGSSISIIGMISSGRILGDM